LSITLLLAFWPRLCFALALWLCTKLDNIRQIYALGIVLPQQLRQLGDIHRNPSRLIAPEQRKAARVQRQSKRLLSFRAMITVAEKTNGRTDARPFGDIKNAML
jgi:hypothetical protein